ncbi:male-specific lethal 1 homolog [Phlebotomus argentipes]|uniref:male-specific lethal 1 homolog n=1 Tax=Phlebotomus argentipes TaxID=94469 RepID=UPI002892B350|nr:male-specific lethal 1 homolog [Phlebotomus argentipes]
MSSRSSKNIKQDVHNLDHLYCHKAENSAYIKSSPSSDLISIIKENKQLKSMLLLHLDLIQEQSDQLLTKEKQISSLRQENESLKLKIERMERRMHIKQSRSILHHLPTVDGKAKNNGAPKPHFRIDLSAPAAKCDNGLDEVKPNAVGLATEKALEANGMPIGKIVLNNAGNIENITSVVQQVPEIKVESNDEGQKGVLKAEEPPPMQPMSPEGTADADKGSDEGSGKRRLSETSAVSAEQGKKALKLMSMTTNKQYVTRDWELVELEEDVTQLIEKRGDLEINLEVPSWRIVEGDAEEPSERPPEVLAEGEIREEAYMKRHLKFEIDERRRKKWDVQRIREQRTIERLKKRHYKLEVTAAGEEKSSNCLPSFYPSPSSIRFIQITEELPVQAFGEHVPDVTPAEFALPWAHTPDGAHVVLGGPQEADKWPVSTMFVRRASGQKVHHKTPRKMASKAAAGGKR